MTKMVVHKTESFKEAEEFDARFWKKAGAQVRFEAAWDLVKEYLKIRGKDESLQRLRRSVQNIKFL